MKKIPLIINPWVVSLDEADDNFLFRGKSRNSCMTFIKRNYSLRDYKKGKIRISRIFWES